MKRVFSISGRLKTGDDFNIFVFSNEDSFAEFLNDKICEILWQIHALKLDGVVLKFDNRWEEK